MADPRVIQNIEKAAKQTGADPAALLATSLTEDGARLGVVGDNGTSYGAFQFHRGGALGAHAPTWADSYAAFLNRAKEFQRLQVHGGKGAAAVQRPADPTGYATKVDANLARARELLGQHAVIAAAAPKIAAPAAPIATTPSAIPGESLLQSLMDSNANLAGISSFTLPTAPTATPTLPAATRPTPAQQAAKTLRPTGRVIIGKTKIIGTPGSGTHAVAFNRAGGSDNWESERAVDIATPVGTPIYAPTSGVIGSQIGSLGSGGRFAGLRVHLNGGGNEFYFAHLSKLAVKAGQKVQAGQIIGYTGEANGVAHLHLATKNGNPGRYA